MSIAIPRAREDITPEWMTAVLRECGQLSSEGRVTGVTVEDIGVGRGYVGQTLRIASTIEGDRAGAAPASVVAKLPTFIELADEDRLLIDGLYATEIQWYRELSSEVPVRVPDHVWSALDPASSRYCLLLEDLSDLDVTDQLSSCTPAQAELAVETLARIHARWWGGRGLEGLAWLLPVAMRGAIWGEFYRRGWDSFWTRFGAELPEEFATVGVSIRDRAGELFSQGSARSLVHGDYRLENFLFGEAGGEDALVVLDWQLTAAGPALYDLAYFIGQSLTIEARRASESSLVERYRATLEAHGVENYALDACWRDYRLGLLCAMVIPVNGARAFEEMADSVGGDLSEDQQAAMQQAMATGDLLMRAMAERNVTAILDNDAQALL